VECELKSLDPEDQSLWKMTKREMRVSTLSLLWSSRGFLSLSDLEKAEALADSLEAQFQPMTVPSLPAVIDNHINVNHDVALRSYFLTPASERKLTNPDEVHEAIRGLKVVKAPGPNGIPNRALKYLPPASVIPPRPDF
jgi:hypothetical protein